MLSFSSTAEAKENRIITNEGNINIIDNFIQSHQINTAGEILLTTTYFCST